MAEASANTLSRLFTDLLGRDVRFSESLSPYASSSAPLYSVYIVRPMDSTRVIQADALLLASFAGALIGLPSAAVKERLADAAVDDALNDALREVMNIASRIVSVEYRAVFRDIYADLRSLPAPARHLVRDPCYSYHFDVLVDGYPGGRFSLLAPI